MIYRNKIALIVTLLNSLANPKELFSTSNDSMCKANCIDLGHQFCPSRFGDNGTCCDLSDGLCNRYQICSSDAPSSSEGLKYWTCPHDFKVCGESQKKTTQDGKENVIESKDNTYFKAGSICRYTVEFPTKAGDYDKIYIRAS